MMMDWWRFDRGGRVRKSSIIIMPIVMPRLQKQHYKQVSWTARMHQRKFRLSLLLLEELLLSQWILLLLVPQSLQVMVNKQIP